MQYSMLPVQRVAIGDLWKLLTEDRAEKATFGNGHVNGVLRKGMPPIRRGGNWWSR
jgi:hypothetical protein